MWRFPGPCRTLARTREAPSHIARAPRARAAGGGDLRHGRRARGRAARGGVSAKQSPPPAAQRGLPGRGRAQVALRRPARAAGACDHELRLVAVRVQPLGPAAHARLHHPLAQAAPVVTRRAAETVVIGSGVSGALVARELVRAGRQVTVVERGSLVSWEEQVRRRRWEGDSPTSAHNHECDPAGQHRHWQYVYGVGGTSNSWAGNSPRLLPEDFESRSRHGVGRDWPISYEELNPYYVRAEAALGIAGNSNGIMPGASYPLPAHPPSPIDEALAPLLEPFIPMPQARASIPVRGREACNGSADCTFCPLDARFSVLNGIPEVVSDPDVELL